MSLASAGCAERTHEDVIPSESAVATAAGGASGSVSTGTNPEHPGRVISRHGIAWYEDDPEAAFRAARAAGKRVVVDLWAPWCHTCLSMQSHVLTAANLPNLAERFVWLAVDTERESNAALLSQLPPVVWPTFYVVDPNETKVFGRWLGAASPGQFARFVTESDRSAELARAGTGAGGGTSADPLLRLVEADALAARGEPARAAAAYAAALSEAPPDWPRRPETLVAQITALAKLKDIPACIELSTRELGHTGSSASAVDFSHHALGCAAAAPASPALAALQRAIAARLEPLCRHGSGELTPDDQADACDKLAAARAALGDEPLAREATEARLSVLERASAGRPPEVALTHDWARTDALIALGRAEEALALATQRERELPGNYNPPHYRAKSLKALGRWAEGLAALERASTLAYGPRKVGLLTLKADLLFAAGDAAEGVRTLEQQLAAYRALPEGQRQPSAEARVEQRLRAVAGTPAGAASSGPAPGR